MKMNLAFAGLASGLLALSAIPDMSYAHQTGYRHSHRHHSYQSSRYSGCEANRHRKARNGTVIGALGGGFLGSQVAGLAMAIRFAAGIAAGLVAVVAVAVAIAGLVGIGHVGNGAQGEQPGRQSRESQVHFHRRYLQVPKIALAMATAPVRFPTIARALLRPPDAG